MGQVLASGSQGRQGPRLCHEAAREAPTCACVALRARTGWKFYRLGIMRCAVGYQNRQNGKIYVCKYGVAMLVTASRGGARVFSGWRVVSRGVLWTCVVALRL